MDKNELVKVVASSTNVVVYDARPQAWTYLDGSIDPQGRFALCIVAVSGFAKQWVNARIEDGKVLMGTVRCQDGKIRPCVLFPQTERMGKDMVVKVAEEINHAVCSDSGRYMLPFGALQVGQEFDTNGHACYLGHWKKAGKNSANASSGGTTGIYFNIETVVFTYVPEPKFEDIETGAGRICYRPAV